MALKFKDYLTESIVDPEKPSLSPEIFDDPTAVSPKIKEKVIKRVKSGVEKIDDNFGVVGYTLIGSILTKRYNDKSDIDVNVQIRPGKIDMAREYVASISEKNVPGTKHPVNFHVVDNEKDFDNANESADAVFDVEKNEFARRESPRPFHVEQYWGEFKKVTGKIDFLKDELKDDLIDYAQLKSFDKVQLQELRGLIDGELKEIEKGAIGLANLYDQIKDERRQAFQRPLTPQDIREYGAKNRLPENVIYKLLEKHHYLGFLEKVDEILGDDKKLSKKEAEKLSKLVLKKDKNG